MCKMQANLDLIRLLILRRRIVRKKVTGGEIRTQGNFQCPLLLGPVSKNILNIMCYYVLR